MARKKTSPEIGPDDSPPTKATSSPPESGESAPTPRGRRTAKPRATKVLSTEGVPKSRPQGPLKASTAPKSSTKTESATRKAAKTSKTAPHPTRKARLAPKAKVGNDGKAPKRAKLATRPKTRLSPQDLQEFRQMLIDKRRELVGDVTNLENEAMRQGDAGGRGGSSSMPIHMADLGSDTWEQELTLGLIANERGLLREIDEALDRIDRKTYGICLATNKPITKSRLRAQPWAKYCIEYARKRELGLV